MKFNAIVGNPPYQEKISNEEANSSLGKQLFPNFIISAVNIEPDYISMITPSRWFAGDAQDKSFLKLREFIKENNHIKKLYNYPNCNEVFNNVVIKGGVNYFLYDKEYKGKVDFYTKSASKIKLQKRDLFEEGLDIIISNEEDYAIINKIINEKFESFTKITTGRNAFGIIGKEDVLNKITSVEAKKGFVKVQCKNEQIRWIERNKIVKNQELINYYKVFISKSAGDPSRDLKVIGKPYIGGPNTICTDSLIPVGKFKTLQEAENLQKYMKTKFLRYLVSILKVSQNVTQIVYKFVPIQDFTNNSDINWNCSVKEIDIQLYKKYKLTINEIQYIDRKIKELE